ncbi:RNA dependent RNA polymerase-domain-containing protein [Mycena maculata]|uniref:RNA-dependent RNA polymerase n=1 Tax=Mycena maculata TaxID=230809 RepID=A0AAD7JD44_9AGAR|nr:RNA dependent RNA polymerase-domain-containing protein [Mycena maculata]
MGDAEMTPSQIAYNQLDESYPPTFWDEVSEMDGQLPSQVAYNRLDDSYPPTFWEAVSKLDGQLLSTQGPSGADTVPNSSLGSLSDVADAVAAAQPHGPEIRESMVPTIPTKINHRSTSHPVNGLQINASPSRSPMSKPCMPPPKAGPSGSPSRVLNHSGAGGKRPCPDTGLPPAKMRRVASDPINDRTGGTKPKPLSSRNTAPAGVLAGPKPVSSGPGPDAFSLPFLFRGRHGKHLESFVISHSSDVQPYLDRLQIARGVQWELVRGITSGSWTWQDVKTKLSVLKGSNADIAPRVRDIMLGGTSRGGTLHETSLWQELDREANATVEHKSRGLGLLGEFEGVSDYHGGNVQCIIRLLDTGDDVIALRDDKGGAVLRKWAARKFIFCGRVYVALPPKSGKVYLIETDEDYGRVPQEWCGDQHRISYDEYIRTNNPMDLNANQPFAKYLTRLNLYLSTSIPALEFSAENIFFIDDLYADGWSGGKPPAEKIMTDGSGFINRAAALKISSKMKYERLPVAYQGRIAGSKGLWIVHPEDDATEPKIWIRDSQRKIHFRREKLIRRHRIFDLLAVSAPSSSLHLSAQSIIILANNGVPAKVFCSLQEEGLKDLIKPLMDWNRPHATAYLWDAINNISNVTRSRLQRLAAGASRALGFEKRSYGDDSDKTDDADVDVDLRGLTHTGRNAFSGEPLTVPESAMDLLAAGFDPRAAPFLSQKIHNVIKTTMETFLAKYKIPLANSLEAFIIPDPTGELKEGEVFYKSSRDPDTPLREQVVVGRYPMRESSDMQKVTAVDIPALAKYVDVLVTSIHGSRSLASLLAGGDDAIIIRDPTIVDPFQNQPVVPVPEGFLVDNFQRQVQSVTDFGNTLGEMDIEPAQRAFQTEVLAGLIDDKIGVYSIYHDCAVYLYGLDDVKTRRIAHMYGFSVFRLSLLLTERRTSTLLDASKTGLRLLPEVEKADEQTYGKHPTRARCFDMKTGHTKKRKLGPFVLDSLLAAGTVVKDALLVEFETSVASHIGPDVAPDLDIVGLHARMKAAANGDEGPDIAADLDVLEKAVDALRTRYSSEMHKYKKSLNDPKEPWEQRKNDRRKRQSDNPMVSVQRDFRKPIADIKSLHLFVDIDELKASYAIALNSIFGVSMAFRDICELKRRAEMKRGPHNRVAVIEEAKSMGGPARRLLKHLGD